MSKAREYFKSHAVDFKVAAEAGVTADDQAIRYRYEDVDGNEYFRERSFASGICKQPKGQELDLYWPLGRSTALPIMLCEGEADTLAAASILIQDHDVLGAICPVGIPGASFPASRAGDRLSAALPPVVYLCMDPDEAGRKAASRIALELTKRGIRTVVCELSSGHDLSDTLAPMDPEARTEWLYAFLADHDADTDLDDIVSRDIRSRLSA